MIVIKFRNAYQSMKLNIERNNRLTRYDQVSQTANPSDLEHSVPSTSNGYLQLWSTINGDGY